MSLSADRYRLPPGRGDRPVQRQADVLTKRQREILEFIKAQIAGVAEHTVFRRCLAAAIDKLESP